MGLVRWRARSAKESRVCVKLKFTDGKWTWPKAISSRKGKNSRGNIPGLPKARKRQGRTGGRCWGADLKCETQVRPILQEADTQSVQMVDERSTWMMRAGPLNLELWMLRRCYLGKEGQRRGFINFLEHLWLCRKTVYQGNWKGDGIRRQQLKEWDQKPWNSICRG